jgi:hypothetical protein
VTWKKGQSGNPGGRGSRRLVTDSLVRELSQAAEDGDGNKARSLAKALVKRAIEGDTRAADIVLERVEGKAEQVINVRRTIRDFTDDELLAIASGSGDGSNESSEESPEPSQLH